MLLIHLKMIEEWAHDLQVALVNLKNEDSKVLHAGAAIKRICGKINAKRWD